MQKNLVNIDHISISSIYKNDIPDFIKVGAPYKIVVELNFCPLDAWKTMFYYIWSNSSYNKDIMRNVLITENLIEIIIEDSNLIQYTIESLCDTVQKANNLSKSQNINVHLNYYNKANIFTSIQ